MGRILAISDIHGCYDEFCEMLNLVEYDSRNDQLILVGDYVDRGPNSKEVVDLVKSLVDEHGAIALKGNHDDMFVKHILTDDEQNHSRHLRNGGFATFQSYYGLDWDLHELDKAKNYILHHYFHHIEFLRDLAYYHETERYIFVHAGINPLHEDWKDTSHEEMIWIRESFFAHPTQTDKKVIFGHTPCIKLHGKEDVWFGGDKLGIDGACVFGHQLNCLEINENGYKYYSVKNKNKELSLYKLGVNQK
jgi:serine/threonine protein phosphatase 1